MLHKLHNLGGLMTDKEYYEINAHYRRNPPAVVLDDLGMDHQIHGPLPAKYKRAPCDCGKIHNWEDPSTFEIVEIAFMPDFIKKVKRCIDCKTFLVLKLHEKIY